jgi:hypothetical protein
LTDGSARREFSFHRTLIHFRAQKKRPPAFSSPSSVTHSMSEKVARQSREGAKTGVLPLASIGFLFSFA